MADVELLVEMRELASGVLEKEAPANGKRDPKQIHQQHGGKDKDLGAINYLSLATYLLSSARNPLLARLGIWLRLPMADHLHSAVLLPPSR